VAFRWTLGELADGMVVYRAYDGDAHVVFFGPPGCEGHGNGWPPCTHLGGPRMAVNSVGEGAILFFAGSPEELKQEVRRVRRRLGDPGGHLSLA